MVTFHQFARFSLAALSAGLTLFLSDAAHAQCVPGCSGESVTANGMLVCGPDGSTTTSGLQVPPCVCKGDDGCQGPCFGVTCDPWDNQECVEYGAFAGQCQNTDNCYFFGCEAGRICSDNTCVNDPCAPNPCQPEEVCKFDALTSWYRCVGSCADVHCTGTTVCRDGACEPTGCAAPCPEPSLCDGAGECVDNRCPTERCTNGAYCYPAYGHCGDDPCSGVVCPAEQLCLDGECFRNNAAGGSGGSGGSAAGGAGSGGSSVAGAGGSNVAGAGGAPGSSGGLGQGASAGATSGAAGASGNAADTAPEASRSSGCDCRAAGSPPSHTTPWLALAALGLLGARRPRRSARHASR